MAKNKTIETQDSVAGFLTTIKDEKRRKECSAIMDLITEQDLNHKCGEQVLQALELIITNMNADTKARHNDISYSVLLTKTNLILTNFNTSSL